MGIEEQGHQALVLTELNKELQVDDNIQFGLLYSHGGDISPIKIMQREVVCPNPSIGSPCLGEGNPSNQQW